jgi:SAM-dependent methyltransferase
MTKPTRNALDVILRELAPLGGKKLLDIGCGTGGLRGPLERAGAQWRGLDPGAKPAGLPIDVAPAEAMPYADASFDAAICVNALHHVPVPFMAAALNETARVLRPGGLLVVIEPKATGTLSQVIAVVDDETEIRGAAQDAMNQTVALAEVTAYDYARTERYANFDEFCDVLISVDPARAPEIAAHSEDLRRAFEKRGGRDGDIWTLSQPMSARVFRPA